MDSCVSCQLVLLSKLSTYFLKKIKKNREIGLFILFSEGSDTRNLSVPSFGSSIEKIGLKSQFLHVTYDDFSKCNVPRQGHSRNLKKISNLA